MEVSDQTKKLLKKLGIALLAIVVLALVTFLVCRVAAKSSKPVLIKFEMIGPNFDRSTTVTFTESRVKVIDVGSFVEQILINSHLSPWKGIYIYWTKLTINGKDVSLTDGTVSEKDFPTLIPEFLGGVPDKISVVGDFKHTCTENDLKRVQATCDPCKGEKAMCTATGPLCIPNKVCPDQATMLTCCSDPNVYATCSKSTNYAVVCGPCPETDKPDCGPVGCDCKGPLCTGTGWICAAGVVCPTGPELAACCTGPSDHATCSHGKIYCTPCTGKVPDCKPDCDNHGLVCNPNGEWTCEPGVRCPPDDIQRTCCKDPSKPFPICKPGDSSVQCGTCPNKPSDNDCAPDCFGRGWVCTSTGWICTTGVVCPDEDTIKEQKCCPESFQPYCDPDNHCIQCKCPAGQNDCGDIPGCATQKGPRPPKCCANGVSCSKNPLGEYMCCKSGEQACDNGCCPAETLCDNGKCTALCGVDGTGKPVTCKPDEECVLISGLTGNQANKIKAKYPDARYDPHKQILYLCAQSTETCQFGVDEGISVPSSINDFYGCYPFPIGTDSETASYCVGIKDEDTTDCFSHKTTDDCKSDAKCQWRDVLGYLSQGESMTDLETRANQLETDMGYIQQDWNGSYCQPTDTDQPYQRVVAFDGGSNCTWKDCFSQISQPGIIDVEFNENTKTCVGLQACNSAAGKGLGNNVLDGSGNTYKNPNIQTPISNKKGNISDFVSCGSARSCASLLGDKASKYVCDVDTGRVQNLPVWAGTNPHTPLATCEVVNNPPPNVSGYKDRQSCYNDICSPESDKSCCLPGWTWDKESMKCYIDQPSTQPDHCGKIGSTCHDGNHYAGDCGKSWYAYTHGHCAWLRSCDSSCWAGISGSVGPDNDGSDPTKTTVSHDRPYCVCDNSNNSWVNVTDSTYEFGNGDRYACKIGDSSAQCNKTYS